MMENISAGFPFPPSINDRPVILCLTSYPPRECGIATYSQDLIVALKNKFSGSFAFGICALETEEMNFEYPPEVHARLDTSDASSYVELADRINDDPEIKAVLLQHEFGFFAAQEKAFLHLLYELRVPVVVVFNTVLTNKD